jgi:hypothetical protein
MRGLVIEALARPELATHRVQAGPFGAATADEWSLPALGLASIGAAFLEPDPAFEWDDKRLTRIHQLLEQAGSQGRFP